MNRFRMPHGVALAATTLAVIAITFLMEMPHHDVIAAPPDQKSEDAASALHQSEIAAEELRLAILEQQIVVAGIELDILGSTCQATAQEVAAAQARLDAENLEYENANRLYEKQVVSEIEVQLHEANRRSFAAEVKIAEARHETAIKSVKLKEANIALLKLRVKAARLKLETLRQNAGTE